MNRTLPALALTAVFACVPAQAGPLEDRIELLSKQVLELQDQVSLLRSMLNRDSTGKVVVTSSANRHDLVGTDFSTSVGGNATQRVSNSLSVAAAREILLQAGDQITLKTGSASIVMRKNGEITITGTTIRVLGSGDVVIKGSKVLTN